MLETFINLGNVVKSLENFRKNGPFSHCVVDGFFTPKVAEDLSKEFMDYDDPNWFYYKNSIEDKKACNNWHCFPPTTYKAFSHLNSENFTRLIRDVAGGIKHLYPDYGLNGGGWHMHGPGGVLNPHLDYNIHPKLGLQRVLNIIVYLSKELEEEHGGHLGLWTNNPETNQPDKLVKEIQPIFNRAVIFDTTQNSWHGISRPLTQPAGIYRKSIAIYYLQEPPADADPRGRALFAPTEAQKGDESVLQLIKLRSDVATSSDVYQK